MFCRNNNSPSTYCSFSSYSTITAPDISILSHNGLSPIVLTYSCSVLNVSSFISEEMFILITGENQEEVKSDKK